jgi:hypothetical protein
MLHTVLLHSAAEAQAVNKQLSTNSQPSHPVILIVNEPAHHTGADRVSSSRTRCSMRSAAFVEHHVKADPALHGQQSSARS